MFSATGCARTKLFFTSRACSRAPGPTPPFGLLAERRHAQPHNRRRVLRALHDGGGQRGQVVRAALRLPRRGAALGAALEHEGVARGLRPPERRAGVDRARPHGVGPVLPGRLRGLAAEQDGEGPAALLPGCPAARATQQGSKKHGKFAVRSRPPGASAGGLCAGAINALCSAVPAVQTTGLELGSVSALYEHLTSQRARAAHAGPPTPLSLFRSRSLALSLSRTLALSPSCSLALLLWIPQARDSRRGTRRVSVQSAPGGGAWQHAVR